MIYGGRWQRKPLTYDILIPSNDRPMHKMTPKMAQRYFDWFISMIPSRVEYLSRRCAEYLGIDMAELDLSEESLRPIWRYFLEVAEVEEIPPPPEGSKEPEGLTSFQRYILEQSTHQLSLQTEYILRDIGMYLGEVFVRNYPQLRWGFYTRPKDIHMNHPVILGFVYPMIDEPTRGPCFEPIHMARVQASKLLDGRQMNNGLYFLFRQWTDFIPENKHDA